MNLEIYHIRGSAFHFGRQGPGEVESNVTFPSDSLFAAMVFCASQLYGSQAIEEMLEPFRVGKPPFLLSSVFPRAGGVRFYPKPFRLGKIADPNRHEESLPPKKVKKIAFVSENIFKSLLNSGSLTEEIKKGVLMQDGSVLISREEFATLSSDFRKEPSVPEQRKKTGKADSEAFGERSLIETKLIWQRIKRPRVTVDRENSASTLYFLDEVRFAPHCGLWFGVKRFEDSDESRDKFDGILTELSCAGWGGKRSIGLGNYNYAPEPPITLPDAETSAAVPWVSLSRYLPAVDEIPALSDSHSAYALDRVGGWLSPEGKAVERRRNLNLIREGSVLAPGRKAVYGSMADVQPDYQGNRPVGHPVWRNGYALAVGYPALAEKGTENDKI